MRKKVQNKQFVRIEGVQSCQSYFGFVQNDIVRRGGLMVSVLDSGVSAPSSSLGRRHCVVFLGKTLDSHAASLHPGV